MCGSGSELQLTVSQVQSWEQTTKQLIHLQSLYTHTTILLFTFCMVFNKLHKIFNTVLSNSLCIRWLCSLCSLCRLIQVFWAHWRQDKLSYAVLRLGVLNSFQSYDIDVYNLWWAYQVVTLSYLEEVLYNKLNLLRKVRQWPIYFPAIFVLMKWRL